MDDMDVLIEMSVSPDGTQVAVADMHGVIRVWDTSSHRLIRTITLHGVRRRFRDIFYAPDSRHVIVLDVNGVIYVFRVWQ